ncbi:hypothetical protein V6N13_106299 [Hibiscus sabdariffa]
MLATMNPELQKQHEDMVAYKMIQNQKEIYEGQARHERYGYIYLMCHKSEALEKLKDFINEVQNQHGKSIKALRSDRGGEYLSHEFDELLKECGIVSQLAPPGMPQWNGPLLH